MGGTGSTILIATNSPAEAARLLRGRGARHRYRADCAGDLWRADLRAQGDRPQQLCGDDLAKKGAIFVNELDEVPEGARVIYSAHGVSPAVRQHAKERGLKVIDATCPLVTKVHVEAIKFAKQGYSLVLVGHRDHEEVEGTQGEAPDVTQVVSTLAEVERWWFPIRTRWRI
jgi:hypothetical protein